MYRSCRRELDAVERRDGDVDVAGLDELLHLAVEERQQQRPDVRAVDVGVGHDDHAVVPQLLDVELVADATADGGDDRLDLGVREHLVDAVLLAVDDLAAERQDRLEVLVARVDGGAARRVALDEVDLAALGVVRLAVGELAGEAAAGHRALAADLARLARRLAGARGVDRLRDDPLALGRVLVEELGELLVHRLLDEGAHPGVAELRLRLALELGLAELDGDDRGEALADVVAFEVVLLLLQLALFARELVDRRRQRGREARRGASRPRAC